MFAKMSFIFSIFSRPRPPPRVISAGVKISQTIGWTDDRLPKSSEAGRAHTTRMIRKYSTERLFWIPGAVKKHELPMSACSSVDPATRGSGRDQDGIRGPVRSDLGSLPRGETHKLRHFSGHCRAQPIQQLMEKT